MITAIFNPGDKSITTEKVMQWDYGQVLSIKGLDLPKAVEIHFCVYTDSTTIPAVGITTDDHTDVEIPDGLLRQERELRAYVYVADLEQGKTVRTVNIPIQRRQKPEIPHTPEDAEVFRKAIKAVNNSADRAETAANTSEQNAKKTAEDRTAIAEMVETVSGIEQQVQDVKKYAGQAKTAVENALLSEQEAKKSEEAALQHRTGAETAENNAELAEQNAKKSEQAVEQAKQLVMQMGQEVLDNKNYVDGKVEEFNKTVKDASDAIETVKTDAVDAVETAGTEYTKEVTDEGAKQVKAVEDKGNEVLQSIPRDFTTQMASKLDKQQGTENNGKILGIGEDGLIIPVDKPSGGGTGGFSGDYNDLTNKPIIPTKLPNPHTLTFNGAVTAEYDGSGAVTVTIPNGVDTKTERIEKLATDTEVELEPNKLYIFPEIVNLTYTLKEPTDKNVANEYHFVFTSGASPTQVVHPLGVKIGVFTVEANKIYEVSVMENLLTSQSWEVV